MKERLRLFKRGAIFYYEDTDSGKQFSLGTRHRGEAVRLIELKRQSFGNIGFTHLLLKTCVASLDPLLLSRTWQTVMDQMLTHGKPSTKERCKRAMASKHFNPIRNKKLLETHSADLLAVINSCPPSANHYLRRLHNLAVGLGWVSIPILAPKLWPRPLYRDKRAITLKEHQEILANERNLERNFFYQLLWEIGSAQTDTAELTAEQIDWTTGTISFQRKKTGSWSHIVIGKSLQTLLKQLPTQGPLFPAIQKTSANDRSAEFYRRCKILKIEGVTLHSYRYAWAERAKVAGYPERFAQEALGHNSKAVHRAYARKAQVKVPSLEDYESGSLREGRSQFVPAKSSSSAYKSEGASLN